MQVSEEVWLTLLLLSPKHTKDYVIIAPSSFRNLRKIISIFSSFFFKSLRAHSIVFDRFSEVILCKGEQYIGELLLITNGWSVIIHQFLPVTLYHLEAKIIPDFLSAQLLLILFQKATWIFWLLVYGVSMVSRKAQQTGNAPTQEQKATKEVMLKLKFYISF